jgi:hypothetical protein
MSHILITDLLRRRLAVWLAVLVVGLGALAPTVSHALVLMRGGSPAAVEICTPAGPRWLTVADDQSSAGIRLSTRSLPVLPAIHRSWVGSASTDALPLLREGRTRAAQDPAGFFLPYRLLTLGRSARPTEPRLPHFRGLNTAFAALEPSQSFWLNTVEPFQGVEI